MEKPDILARLKQAGRLTPADQARIAKYLEEKAAAPEQALFDLEVLPEQEIAYFLCETYGLPFARLRQVQVPPRALKLIGLERMESDWMVPVCLRPDGLTVAVANPGRLPDLAPLAEYFQCPIRLEVAVRSELQGLLGRLRAGADQQPAAGPSAEPVAAAGPASDTELMRLLGRVLLEASRGRVSDVHLCPAPEGLEVRFRRDGMLEDRTIPLSAADQTRLIDLIKRLSGLDPRDRKTPRSGRMRLPVGDREDKRDLTMRVSCAPTLVGERLAIRVVEAPDRRFALDALGFSRPNLQRIRNLLRSPTGGLVLVGGPLKSGRSTTLSAALAEIPSDGFAIFSVEDPIEQKLAGVCQMQAETTAVAVAAAPPPPGVGALIAAAVEQDADVVMVSEIADAAAARQAVAAAIGGRLVLAGVTACDAGAALQLLLALGAQAVQLGNALRAVVAQRLVRKLCTACRRPIYRMPEEIVVIKERLALTGTTLYEPVGCASCGFRGFSGRMAIHEVLLLTPELAAAIQDGLGAGELASRLTASGHRSLVHDGFSKALEGLTTFEEVQRVVAMIAPGVV